MDPINLLFIAGGGALAGLLIGAILASVLAGRSAAALRTSLEDELTDLRTRSNQTAEQLSAARAELAAAQARADELPGLRERLHAEQTRASALQSELSAERTRISEREQALAEERRTLEAFSEQVREQFKALAGDALDASQKKFLERAEATFRHQQERAQGDLSKLVEPIGKTLGEFRQKVEEIEKERATHRGELAQQITFLSQGLARQQDETAKLVNALQRSSTTRGQWGERTVENILELAGLTKGVDYDPQHHTRDSEGRALRPDFVVKLPGGGRFVIDSKVALTAYLDAVDASNEETRKQHLRRHAAQVKTHVKALSGKDYVAAVDGAIDFVALFIPGESFYAAAIEEDPNLFDEAIRANVIIVTPATLLALAKAVSYGWNQQRLEENAEKIATLGAELYDRVGVFAGHLDRVGSGLRSATSNYNKAVASLESRVLVSARRMAELNASAAKTIDAPSQVEESPRALSAPQDDDS